MASFSVCASRGSGPRPGWVLLQAGAPHFNDKRRSSWEFGRGEEYGRSYTFGVYAICQSDGRPQRFWK